MIHVAVDMRLLMGLRLAVGQDEPLPYSARFAAKRMRWTDPRRANRAINKLCDAGVVDYAGALDPLHGKPYGTKTFRPPLFGPDAFEGEPVVVEGLDRPAVQPAREVEDQAAVVNAESAGVRRAPASPQRADRTIVHDRQATAPTGAPRAEVGAPLALQHDGGTAATSILGPATEVRDGLRQRDCRMDGNDLPLGTDSAPEAGKDGQPGLPQGRTPASAPMRGHGTSSRRPDAVAPPREAQGLSDGRESTDDEAASAEVEAGQ